MTRDWDNPRPNQQREHAPRSLPARYPEHGAWPGEMRADLTAGYFDFETTGQLYKAIQRGEAPRPTSTRLRNGRREPVWARIALDAFIAGRHGLSGTGGHPAEDIGKLV